MANSLHGFEVQASDGASGRIDDFYFNDQTWNICHVVVDVGGWLMEKKVLLSPEVFGHADWRKKHIEVKITRKQIGENPDADTIIPDGLQYEKQASMSIMQSSMVSDAYLGIHQYMEPFPAPADEKTEPHLKSVRQLKDWAIVSPELKVLGRIIDFLIDTETWGIKFLLLKTNDGRIFLTQPHVVKSIDVKNNLLKIAHPEEVNDWQEYDPHYMAMLEVAQR
jgi:sporulation protein YlmC with PRC-barrel domain